MKNQHAPVLLRRTFMAAAIASAFVSNSVFPNPTGPTVVNGTATIVPAGSVLTVTNTPNTIINWQGFSIAAGETTRFVQQSAASAVLNRVTTLNNPSNIFGTLQSNGRVFLINPSGILFGSGSQVDVAGLVASTLRMTDEDFLAGRLRFAQQGTGSPPISNFGSITTQDGGEVYLIAPNITQAGVINSPTGEVLLVGARTVELVDPKTPNLRVELNAPNDGFVINAGQIMARAGRIGIFAGLINHDGQTRADTVEAGENGEILLRASGDIHFATTSLVRVAGFGANVGAKVDIEAGDDLNINGGLVGREMTIRAGGDILFHTGNPLAGANVDANRLLVEAGGNIAMNSTGPLGQTILNVSELTLVTTTPGKTITQGPDSFIENAHTFILQANGDVSLLGPNRVLVVRGTVGSGGSLTFNGANPTFTALANLAVDGALDVTVSNDLEFAGTVTSAAQNINVPGNITNSTLTGGTLTALGPQTINAGGSLLVQGGELDGASATISATGPVSITTGGDLLLQGGSGRNATALIEGGTGLKLTVGGTLRLNAGSGSGTWARLRTPDRLTPIEVSFPNLSDGGYFVNDVEGVTRRGRSGIFTGNRAAIPGETLILDYGLAP